MTSGRSVGSGREPVHSPRVPPLSDCSEIHAALASSLVGFDPHHLAAQLGGLLATPQLRSNTLRLEVLQHLALCRCSGQQRPSAADLQAWFVELGQGPIGRMEPPAEDVLVSRVSFERLDFLFFPGLFEGATFQLQLFLNVLDAMPEQEDFLELKRAIRSLLRLSDSIVHRTGLEVFGVGQETPASSIPKAMLGRLQSIAELVKFTSEDLEDLGIDLVDLNPFVIVNESRTALCRQELGHTSLERRPLLMAQDGLCVALPTAVSAAVRRAMVEFCLARNMTLPFYRNYVTALARTFADIPLLTGGHGPELSFQYPGGLAVANVARKLDSRRILHFCFIVDDFRGAEATGLAQLSPNVGQASSIVEKSLDLVLDSTDNGPHEYLSLVVVCGWGRPMALALEGNRKHHLQIISAADLETLCWERKLTPLTLWSLLDARVELRSRNVELINANGLLNLYAWADSLNGHLVPHGEIPDDGYDPDHQLAILVEQNALLPLRRRVALSQDCHHSERWDGRRVKVRRQRLNPFFEQASDDPTYGSLDDLIAGDLVSLVETEKRDYWASVEVPNIGNRDLHYRLWHAATIWLRRAAEVFEAELDGLPDGPVAWICEFHDSDPTGPVKGEPASPAEAKSLLEVSAEAGVVRVRALPGFLSAFRHPTNVAEKLLVEALVTGVLQLCGLKDVDMRAHLIDQIVPNEWARDMHFLTARSFRDFVAESIPSEPIIRDEIDDALERIGLGWRARSREMGARVEGIDACCSFLAAVVDSIWERIRSQLETLNREQVLLTLLGNFESIEMASSKWHRTARAVTALHDDDAKIVDESAHQISRFTAGSLGTRLLLEMALCDCPSDGGTELGALDIRRLMARALQMHVLGGWSEAIYYGAKPPEIRITPLGDVHSNTTFDESIAQPYGMTLGANRFRGGADAYESLFVTPRVVESAESAFDPAFWRAWVETFGFTIDQLRSFMDALDDEGLRQGTFAFSQSWQDLCDLSRSEGLGERTVSCILDALVLAHRATWASTPASFRRRDWYPWRFRRRLSVVSRPILEVTGEENGRYLISPSLVRIGAKRVIGYCLEGGYEARDFSPGPMRAWIGAAENRRGHDFNKEVAKHLRGLGWEARSDLKLTTILNLKLDKAYGDVDVLAWRGPVVLVIECKDLQRAMTTGEIARQLSEFRGEQDKKGKPDRLARHIRRVGLLREHIGLVQNFIGTTRPISMESLLIFSDIVPMHFSGTVEVHGTRVLALEELGQLSQGH